MFYLFKKLLAIAFLLPCTLLWAQDAKFDEFLQSTYKDCKKEVSSFLDSNQTPVAWRKAPLQYGKICDCSKEKVQADAYIKRIITSTNSSYILISRSASFNSRVELKLLSSIFVCLSDEMDKRLQEIQYKGK